MRPTTRRAAALVAGVALLATACGGDDDDTGAPEPAGDDAEPAGDGAESEPADDAEEVTLTLLIDNAEQTVTLTEGVTAAFTELNPHVTFDIEQRPGGADGDNVVKTRLATGEMTDVFFYNSGSLLQALNPTETLLDLTGETFVENVSDAFIPAVSQDDRVFGVPFGTGMGGGVIYNKAIFDEHGLSVPTTWEEFAANNDTLLEAGVTPLGGTFADTWTSQLLVLADYHNVAQEEPDFADEYTANQAKYATTPAALRSFERLQEAAEKGWWNVDYASATFDDGLLMVAMGDVAQYPMLSFALPTIAEINPDVIDDIGFFAQPGEDAATNGLTVWLPGGAYISATTDHPDVARDFLAFLASIEGVEAQTAASPPAGPYFINGATLPDEVFPAVADIQAYIDSGKASPALEFLSPVKGPALEQITVEVGSGLRRADDAAELYDQDVEKQALQLGLEGW